MSAKSAILKRQFKVNRMTSIFIWVWKRLFFRWLMMNVSVSFYSHSDMTIHSLKVREAFHIITAVLIIDLLTILSNKLMHQYDNELAIVFFLFFQISTHLCPLYTNLKWMDMIGCWPFAFWVFLKTVVVSIWIIPNKFD